MKTINKRMYDYPAGGYCGVIMPESVMKKLAKLNCKYSEEVRKVLDDNKDDLYPSLWTLANRMDGEKIAKQVTIKYVTTPRDVENIDRRISLFKAASPEYVETVYIVESYDEAKEIAESILLDIAE